MRIPSPPAYEFGPFRLDPGDRRLRRGGRAVPLTPKAVQILFALVEAAGRTLGKRELLGAVWPNAVVEENTLARNISTLRRALGEQAGDHEYVATIPGQGYRFVAPVRRRLDSIAVLPFSHVGPEPDPGTEALGDGIAECLIDSLSRLRDVRVLPRTSVFRYKGRDVDPLALGRELDVRALLTGQVAVMGESLIIKVELVDVASERQVWGDRYRRRLTDIFSLQEVLAREICERLHVRLGIDATEPLTRRHTGSSEAYQRYLLGRFHLGKRTRGAIASAISHFERAVDQDPGYALAFAGLADACALSASGADVERAPALVARARAAARKSIDLDETLAEGHASLAFVLFRHDWAWSDAESEFGRALELEPAAATAHHGYAMFLATMGRIDEAVAQIRRALEIDPLSLVVNAAFGRISHFGRRYDDAVEQYRRTLELDSNFAEAHFDLAMSFEEQGRYPEARRELEATIALSGADPTHLAELARCHALAGDRAEARRMLDSLWATSPRLATLPLDSAYVHLALGDKARALACLEEAYAGRCGRLVYLKVDPALDGLRSEESFQALLRRVGLE